MNTSTRTCWGGGWGKGGGVFITFLGGMTGGITGVTLGGVGNTPFLFANSGGVIVP